MSKTIGVIGLGNISARHRRNIKQLYPESEIVCMASSKRKILEDIPFCDQIADNLEEMINVNPRFVIVASPAPYHARDTVALLKAGIPTLVEKPLASSLLDAEEISKTFENTRTVAAVGYCLRFLPALAVAREVIKLGDLGEIYSVHCSVGQYLPDWRPTKNFRESVSANKELGGGVLLELSHELDYLSWLLGELKPKFAVLRQSNQLNLDVEDMADIVLTAGKTNRSICVLHMDFIQKTPERICRIIGENGVLEIDFIKNYVLLKHDGNNTILYSDAEFDKNDIYLSMLKEFVVLIEGKKIEKIATIEDAKNIVRLIQDIREVAKKCSIL